ncbi:MAG: hypothetical protein GY842_24675 [bacterium]|nr:hypothetical protein [bacterium]
MMARYGWCVGWVGVTLGLAAGCVQVNDRWIPYHEYEQQQAALADETNDPVTVSGDAQPGSAVSDPTAPASAQNEPAPPESITDFVSRLQAREHLTQRPSPHPQEGRPEPSAPVERATVETQTSANVGLAVPSVPVAVDTPDGVSPARPSEAPRIESVSVVSGINPAAARAAESKTVSANEPLDATEVVQDYSIREYIAMLEEALQSDPADIESQWMLSTMRLMTGEADRASDISDEIAQDPAELLCGALRLFADFRQLLADPAHPADDTLTALEALRVRLQERAELLIPVVAMCTRVRTFGVYDQMPPDQFVPHQANRTVVYTEVKNFVSMKVSDGQYETLLAGRLELLTPEGQVVWQHEEDSIKEVSRQRREDFFLAQLVTFPPSLAAGDYVLKVMIQDLQGGKANEAHLEFAIGQRRVSSAVP